MGYSLTCFLFAVRHSKHFEVLVRGGDVYTRYKANINVIAFAWQIRLSFKQWRNVEDYVRLLIPLKWYFVDT